MRRIARNLLAMLTLAACLGAPVGARAVGYEDSLDDCDYPQTFDLLVMRPVGMTTVVIGAALFVPLFPIALVTVGDQLPEVAHNLVGAPWSFTFERRLGECNGAGLSY